jgi:hypothetical protein
MDDSEDLRLCSFCQSNAASVLVQLPSLRSNKRKSIATPFCLLHYYTTSACRVGGTIESGGVAIINDEALRLQMPPQQELFAEAFVQLQQELQDVALTQYEAHKDDPLSILSELNQTGKKRRRSTMKAPPPKRTTPEGGFLRDVPIPERILRTQQKQMKQQQQLIDRMNQASAASRVDTTQRRKPSRQSIWNVMADTPRKNKSITSSEKTRKTIAPPVIGTIADMDNDRTCTCGSTKVESLSMGASHRNQDMAKAETWGNKDRSDDIVSRYRCTQCGKTWHEEE